MGTGPRIGSAAGRTSAAVGRAGGGGGGGDESRGAAKSGGLVALGLGHAMPEGLGALVEAVLSVDRSPWSRIWDGLGNEATGAAAWLAVDASSVAVAAGIAGVDAGIGAAWSEAGLFEASGAGLASGNEAKCGASNLLSAGAFDASLAAADATRCVADCSAGAALGGPAEIVGAGVGAVGEAACSSAGSFGRAT